MGFRMFIETKSTLRFREFGYGKVGFILYIFILNRLI